MKNYSQQKTIFMKLLLLKNKKKIQKEKNITYIQKEFIKIIIVQSCNDHH